MIEYIKWKDLKDTIKDWEFIELLDESRMYYTSENDGLGFKFKQINLVSYTMGEAWQDDAADCEILLNGTAYFDGIRHLYFGSEESSNYGYFYYPVIQHIQSALGILKELEIKYCPQKD